MKILVAAPTFKGMNYCEHEFFQRIKHMEYPSYDILLVDNTKGETYADELKKIEGIKVIHDDTKEEKSIFRLISSRNIILKYGLEKGYTHILMLDSDVIPPSYAITELVKSNKDIVSGIYYNYFNIDGKIQFLPVAWNYLTEEEFAEMKRLYDVSPSLQRTDIRRHLTEQEIASNKLYEVLMPAAGCMLISRTVFEKVRYGKYEKEGKKSLTGEDAYFIEKAKEHGFTPYCNTKVKCEHLLAGKYKKDEHGNLIHSGFADCV